MNWLNCYEEVKYEVNILEHRLKMIEQYEKNLLEERSKIENTIYLQKELLNQIEGILDNYQGIELKLFKEVVVNGLNVTKAIEKVALEESRDVSTIWKYYYPKVREKISQFQLKEN